MGEFTVNLANYNPLLAGDLFRVDRDQSGKISTSEMLSLSPSEFKEAMAKLELQDRLNIFIEMAKRDPEKTCILAREAEKELKDAFTNFFQNESLIPLASTYKKMADLFERLAKIPRRTKRWIKKDGNEMTHMSETKEGGIDLLVNFLSSALHGNLLDIQRAKSRMVKIFMRLSPAMLSRLEMSSRTYFAGFTTATWNELILPIILFQNEKAQRVFASALPPIEFIISENADASTVAFQKAAIIKSVEELHLNGYTPEAYQQFRGRLEAFRIKGSIIPITNDGSPFIFVIGKREYY